MNEQILNQMIDKAIWQSENGEWSGAYLTIAILAVRILFAWYASWESKQK